MCWYGSGAQTVGIPFFIGIPSAPGYVPKNESNDRFSCMMITTCWILWIPVRPAAARARHDPRAGRREYLEHAPDSNYSEDREARYA